MKVLVMGATGRTGMRLVAHACARGHRVAAIARNSEKLAGHEVEIFPGTPYDLETVERAMAGCDAVINVLNVSRASDNFWAALAAPPDLISKACGHALRAMDQHGIKRYVALGTVGAGESWQSMPFVLRWLVRHSNLRYAFDDHTAQEGRLVASSADYTVARAPMLKDKANHNGVLVVRPGEPIRSSIDRQTVFAMRVPRTDGTAGARRAVSHSATEPTH